MPFLNAIPKDWKTKIATKMTKFTPSPDYAVVLNNVFVPITKLTSKKIYWEIVNKKIKPATAIVTWLDLFPFLEHFNWQEIYSSASKISKEPYLQTFQYKVINRTINCRYNLYKWKLLASGKCYYCEEIDTMEHHFYYCFISNQFWTELFQWLYQIVKNVVRLSVCEIMFGIINCPYGDIESITIINFCVLLGKWYINVCKTGEREPKLLPYLNLVKEKLTILKMNFMLDINPLNYFKTYGKLDAKLM